MSAIEALLLIDHGSRRPEANAVLDRLAALVRAELGPDAIVGVAHMELCEPSIDAAVDACVKAGATEIVAVPCFLAPGRHATEDVPRLIARAAGRHGVPHRVSDVLGPHPLLARLILERAGQTAGPH